MDRGIRGIVHLPAKPREVEASLVTSFIEARSLMDSVVARREFSSPREVADFMVSKRSLWWPSDPTYILEVWYMRALAGKQGGKSLLQQAEEMSPDDTKVAEFGACLIRLRSLAIGSAWLFANFEAKGLSSHSSTSSRTWRGGRGRSQRNRRRTHRWAR